MDVTYQTPIGKIESRRFVGLAATTVQHEIDHLDGILLSDIGLEVDSNFDDIPDEERRKIIDMYLDSIDLRAKDARKMIDEDPELQQAEKAIEFMTKVQTGEVTLSNDTVSKKKTNS